MDIFLLLASFSLEWLIVFSRAFILNVLFLGKIELFFSHLKTFLIVHCVARFIFFADNAIKYKNRKYKLNLKLTIE